MSASPLFIAKYRTEPYQMLPAFGVRPRVIFRPGALGSHVFNVSIASTSASIQNLQWAIARLVTSSANMGVGQLFKNGVSPDQLNRTAGDFTADSWRVGQRVLIQDATTIANDAVDILTASTPLQLQLKAGGGTLAGTETFGPGVNPATNIIPGLYRLHDLAMTAVPVNSGTNSGVISGVKGFDRATNLPILLPDPDSYLELGPTDLLVCSASVTLNASEILDMVTHAGDY